MHADAAPDKDVDPLEPRTIRMIRRFDAPRSRIYRCWTVPEELVRWFPQRIEASLAAGTRSVLIFPDQRVWWDVTVLESDRRFEFHSATAERPSSHAVLAGKPPPAPTPGARTPP